MVSCLSPLPNARMKLLSAWLLAPPAISVVGLIIRDGVLLAAIGLGFGLFGAYFVGRAMKSMLFDVQALDFSAFGLGGTGSARRRNPCLLPACKASRLRRTYACSSHGVGLGAMNPQWPRRESLVNGGGSTRTHGFPWFDERIGDFAPF